MLPVIVIAACSFAPYPDDPPVCLDDAYRFMVEPEVAHDLYIYAREHALRMHWLVYENNSRERIEQWENEVAWRRQCWSDLEDVLYLKLWPEESLKRLRRLRELIGHKDYAEGRMPFPIPNYGPGTPLATTVPKR